MSERQTLCPKCRSWRVDTVTIHNPDTQDMNARATLKCIACGHTWEGSVMSPCHKRQRERGWRI
jgi:hypothetical protein